MAATMLAFGRLTAADYTDGSEAATSPLVERLRQNMTCIEDPQFTKDYHEPSKRNIPNALKVTLNDGTILDEVVVEAPLGHKSRRQEAIPQILEKYKRHLGICFDAAEVKERVELGVQGSKLDKMGADEFMDLFVREKMPEAR